MGEPAVSRSTGSLVGTIAFGGALVRGVVCITAIGAETPNKALISPQGRAELLINIPNALTMMRIFLIPVLVVVFYYPFPNHLVVAAGLFGVAAITDWFDGYLARRLGQMTAFGAFLDPVADKLMVARYVVVYARCLRDRGARNRRISTA